MLWILMVLLLLCLAGLVLLLVQQRRDVPDREALTRLQAREQGWEQTQRLYEEQSAALDALRVENARLQSHLEHEREQGKEKIQLLQNAETRLKTEFENLANRIFESREQAGADLQRNRMTAVLEPFKQQLDDFRKRVEDVHRSETEQAGRLIEQVRNLQTLSNQVSADANQLAVAIKGESKRQGNWGEVIVERMLEASGLTLDREYSRQFSARAAEGSLQRPDFIVHLPGDKAVVLDAKVSLTAYERYCSADDEAQRAAALQEHLASVQRHMEELREKRYDELLGNRTLDFVIMCIPIEPAYQAALQADPDLLYLQAQAPVVITGPATLMITLKLIAQIWRRENENRNAEKIAERAGKMHDHIVRVYESVTEIKRWLENASGATDTALKRIKDGRGNLLTRANELKVLGAKVSKSLPAEVQEDIGADADTDPDTEAEDREDTD